LKPRPGGSINPFCEPETLTLTIVRAGEPGHGIDQQQSRMPRGVDRLAHFVDPRSRSRRSLVVHDADRLDRMARVFAKPALDPLRIDAAAPIGADEFGPQAQSRRHVLPQGGEMSRLIHENGVARGKQIGERGLPGARPRRRIDEDMAVGLEDALDLREDALAQFLKPRPAMIDHGHVHRPQNPVGDRARPRNLQEMPAGAPPFVAAHSRFLRSPFSLPRGRARQNTAALIRLASLASCPAKREKEATVTF
jgi:hypothetical protein